VRYDKAWNECLDVQCKGFATWDCCGIDDGFDVAVRLTAFLFSLYSFYRTSAF